MAFNGSGVFTLVSGNPVVTGTTISSTWANNTLSDIATGLSTTITKDGQSTPTANIPMGGFKFTGLGAGTAAGNSLRWEQLFSQGTPVSVASAATTDIGAQTSVAVEISGTTTITSFGTSYNGPRFLRFTGALILTHNATTLNLPGGANITTATGDTAIAYPNLASNGWNVVSYQRSTYLTPVFKQFVLAKSGANLVLSPSGGNLITINGLACTIPTATVSLAPTGLSATTLYYIYAVATAGVVTSLEASTTIYVASTAAGNIGTLIKTGDETRTLVGMAYVESAATFTDTNAKKFVRTAGNDRGIIATNNFGSDATSAVTAGFAEVAAGRRAQFITWAGENITAYASGATFNSGANVNRTGLGLDSVTVAQDGAGQASMAAANSPIPQAVLFGQNSITEGLHYLTLLGYVNAGTGTWTGTSPLAWTWNVTTNGRP